MADTAQRPSNLAEKVAQDVLRTQKHLEYSFNKVHRLNLLSRQDWRDENLEVLESFASRFARAAGRIVSRYLRFLA